MHGRKKDGSGNPDKNRPGTSRAQSESGRESVGREFPLATELGTREVIPEGGTAQSPAADPVPQRAQFFNFDAQAVRVVGTAIEPWFVAKDVCAVLEIQNARDTLAKSLEDDEKGVEIVYTLGGPQEVATINESGLFALIFRSRKPQARLFRKWVTSEVLPAIRRTGQYQHVPVLVADPGDQSRRLGRPPGVLPAYRQGRPDLMVEHFSTVFAALLGGEENWAGGIEEIATKAVELKQLWFLVRDAGDQQQKALLGLALRRRAGGNFPGIGQRTVRLHLLSQNRGRRYALERQPLQAGSEAVS